MQRTNNNGTMGIHPACASCKHQRKKCTEDCILAPLFPAERSKEFQLVHKVYGVSNVTKMIRNIRVEDRKKAADSLVWDASWRMKDPILGSYGEFKKIYEELKFYKSQNQTMLGQEVMGGYKPATSLLGRSNNNITNGRGIINTSTLNCGYDNGNHVIDLRSYNFPLQHIENSEMLKQERDVGGLVVPAVQPQHSINGFNQFYLTGQFCPINDKTMENCLWEDNGT